MSTITAAIDLGSNSFRLLIASCTGTTPPRVLAKSTETVRLGKQLAISGVLQQDAITRGIAALHIFKKLLADFNPEKIRVCGTAALRNATNSHIFCDLARQQLGTKIDVISAEEEATLSLKGSIAGLNKQNQPILLVDSGGGSTEIIYSEEPDAQKPVTCGSFFSSMPYGAVNLTETFLKKEDGISDIKPLSNFLLKTFQTKLHKLKQAIDQQQYTLVASGGTATSLAALDLDLPIYDENAVQGHCITRDTLQSIISKLQNMPLSKRVLLPALDQQRGEIILAGAMIYLSLLNLLKVEHFMVSDWGLLEGILLSAYSQ